MKVLVVDDDAFLRDMYATKFKEVGHTVATAGNGSLALTMLKEDSFDVVLLDMVMPGMDGISFLTSAVASDGAKNTKFIVLSNQGEESDKKRATEAGAIGYIVKAESVPSDVVAKVETLCK